MSIFHVFRKFYLRLHCHRYTISYFYSQTRPIDQRSKNL